MIQLFSPSATLLGTATSSTAGQDAVLQSIPITVAGLYTVVIGGASSTVGPYNLALTLNAAVELENHGGPTSNTLATAQDIDATFRTLGGAAKRAALIGLNTPPGGTSSGFSDDFESGLGGFVLDNSIAAGLWHLSTGRSAQSGHSITHSLYFGQAEGPSGGGNYNTGLRTAGNATSPTINLPVGSNLLSFNYVLQTENSTVWDLSRLQISIDNGVTFTTLASYNGVAESTTWKSASVDLSAYSGKAVLLRWSFDTVDAGANAFEGWYIDDIQIASAVPSTDYYKFTLNAGDTTSIALKALSGSASDVKLLDANGNILAQNAPASTNFDKIISDFTATTTGTYYLLVPGPNNAGYSLLVTKNADLDSEANDTIATAQLLKSRVVNGDQRVLGNIGGTATSIFNFGEVTPQPIDGLTVNGINFNFSVDGGAPTRPPLAPPTPPTPPTSTTPPT